MKNFNLFIAAMCITSLSFGQQSMSDDMESYSPGDFIAEEGGSLGWSTWSAAPGSAEDAVITDSVSQSGDNSIYMEGGVGHDVMLILDSAYDHGTLQYEMSVHASDTQGFYFNMQVDQTPGNGWTINVQAFDTSMYIYNYDDTGGLAMYTIWDMEMGEWMTLNFNIHPADSSWTIEYDSPSNSESVTFKNRAPEQAVGGVNIYPIDGDYYNFFVDDVSWEWEADAPDTTTTVIDGTTVYIVEGDSFEMWDGNLVPYGVSEIDAGTIAAFPNPANDVITLTFANAIGDVSITLVDISGKEISAPFQNLNGNSINVNVSNIPTGVYTLKGSSDDMTFNKPIVVQH